MAGRKRQVNSESKTHATQPNRGKSRGRVERESAHQERSSSSRHDTNAVGYAVAVAALACVSGLLHRNHIANLFENDRHFSHLSTLERELAFRTEMGLYYSYYKTIIEAPTFFNGLHEIMNDNVTEYPLTINTLKRFNLYPEVLVGLGYRTYTQLMDIMGWPTKKCWQVNREEGRSPVLSCEGLGEPSYFYIESVFLLNGLNMCIFFFFGTYLSGSILGGLLTVICVFYNHGECTRVQWTPPLRESFAYPFFILQMFILTGIIRSRRPSYKCSIPIAITTVCFMLPWQFAQFSLLTQTLAVFATYALLYIDAHKTKVILAGQAAGLGVSCVLLFGNEMLITSFFTAALLTVTVIVFLEPILEALQYRLVIWVSQGVLLITGTLGVKFLLSRLLQMTDDAHIGDILRSKFSNFKNFHTMLYTCAVEFDFLEAETPWRLIKTLLLPASIVALTVVTVSLLMREYREYTYPAQGNSSHNYTNGNTGDGHRSKPSQPAVPRRQASKEHAELVYHGFQLLAFTAMAVIIMRLKLFWTPHLCLITSVLASPKLFGWLGPGWRHQAIVGALIAAMSVQGVANLQQQWSIIGEFSNYPLEQMVEWINENTPPNAVFGGPMPTMATIKLSTGRPIINHPHYEDAGLRERTKMVYTMYSRKPEQEVWQNLRELHVEYAIMEESWCVRQSKPGCKMADVWDIEDSVNQGKEPACSRLYKQPHPYFKRVFRNQIYDILQVLEEPSTSRSNKNVKVNLS